MAPLHQVLVTIGGVLWWKQQIKAVIFSLQLEGRIDGLPEMAWRGTHPCFPQGQSFSYFPLPATAQARTGTTRAGTFWGGSFPWLACWLPAGEVKGQQPTWLRTEDGQAAWGSFVFLGALRSDKERVLVCPSSWAPAGVRQHKFPQFRVRRSCLPGTGFPAFTGDINAVWPARGLSGQVKVQAVVSGEGS